MSITRREFNRARKDHILKSANISGTDFLASDRFAAITVCFSDIEGRLHLLDYDKDFLMHNSDNLTFDGSSIRGFTAQCESDLRLSVDWDSAYWLPDDFGQRKLYCFASVNDKNGKPYGSDMRGVLKDYLAKLKSTHGFTVNVAAEIEGFLFKGTNAERDYAQNGFALVTNGGYFNTLPEDPLRQYIDAVAQVQREAAFDNEKDHPEVAPSQFELNWKYAEALVAADQIQLYKLICRVIANKMGYTASFLPKPIVGINGSGMHTNISIFKDKNLFYGDGQMLSEYGLKFAYGILNRAEDVCAILNPSVNSYRRLDPHYEAPNEVFLSPNDRGAMIRVPLGNKNSARIEVRSVAPDANPYLLIYSLLQAGFAGVNNNEECRGKRMLPLNIYEALSAFDNSPFIGDILGESAVRYSDWKTQSADRCPKLLGTTVKVEEIIYHHEVTNQSLWKAF